MLLYLKYDEHIVLFTYPLRYTFCCVIRHQNPTACLFRIQKWQKKYGSIYRIFPINLPRLVSESS